MSLLNLVDLVVLRRKTESAEKQNRFFGYAYFLGYTSTAN